jgi:diketogulonate reductase-like aldo/keto reductase
MKKSMALMLVILLAGLASAWAFTPPTAEQLEAAANDPTQMESLPQGASNAGLASAWAFTPPTAEQLEAAANDPIQMESLLQGASKDEAAQVVLAVVAEVDKLTIPLAQKKARVGAILAASRVALGAQAGAVMTMVLPHVSANLLPATVFSPVPPLPPPVGRRYEGQ